MANQKRKSRAHEESQSTKSKRMSTRDREKLICKKRLEALDKEESQVKDDRFSPEEKRRLLDAYNENGFNVFQDTKLLHKYLPNRRECDLKTLVQRLRSSFLSNTSSQSEQPLDKWQRLCSNLIGYYARDRKVNLDDVYADALLAEFEDRNAELSSLRPTTTASNEPQDESEPNYPELLKCFAQLLQGKFPDKMSTANARISLELFDHVNSMVEAVDLKSAIPSLLDGTWLQPAIQERRNGQSLALKGLDDMNEQLKKCPTTRDIDKNRNIEALCLELPKIKRITDVLNPLHINETLVSTLIE